MPLSYVLVSSGQENTNLLIFVPACVCTDGFAR